MRIISYHKEHVRSVLSYVIIGIVLFFSVSIGISIANHLLNLWEYNWIVTGIILLVAVLVINTIFLVLWRKWLNTKIINIPKKAMIVWFGVCFILSFGLILIFNPPVPIPYIPAAHKLEVYAKDGSEVRLGKIKIGERKIPLKSIKVNEPWGIENKWLVAKNVPAQLEYNFITHKKDEEITLIFGETSRSGNVDILLDSQLIGAISLNKNEAGETLFMSNVQLPFSSKQKMVRWVFKGLDVLALAWGFYIIYIILYMPLLSHVTNWWRKLSYIPKWIWDGIVILIFILFCIWYFMGTVGDAFFRYVLLSGDAANLASFAAALDHPELFSKDPLLSNPNNFAFYFIVHIPILRLLNHVFGNYGTAFVSLLIPTLFAQLMGFYYLGNVLYRSRFWAFLLTVATAVYVGLPLGEVWGFFPNPLPRIMFQALLPFLLGAAIKWGRRIEFWPWIMGGAGLLVYVHPVSAPAWGVAILLGLWFSAPSIATKPKFKIAVLAWFVFLLVITPFAVNYLATFSHGQTQNYDQVMEILSQRFSPGYLNLPIGLQQFFQQVIDSNWINRGLWIWATAGFGLTTYLQRKRLAHNRHPYILVSWWVGLLLVSVVVPLVDHEISGILRRTPLEFDLIRGLRYTIPMLWIVSFWTLSEVYNGLQQWASRKRHWVYRIWILPVVVVGVGLVAAWENQYQFISGPNIKSTFTCWTQGMFVCPNPEAAKRADFLDAVRVLTPPGDSIFFPDLGVRYYALRSLTYVGKDGGALGYANHDALIKWSKLVQEIKIINQIQDKSLAQMAYLEFARRHGADYLVFKEKYDVNWTYPPEMKLIYTNSYGSLFEVIR